MSETYLLSDKEFEAVTALDSEGRYGHFIKRVTDWECVWGLRNSAGWVAAGDQEGNEGFPVWPHPDYAVACALGEWAGNEATPIGIHEFMETWLPNMASENVSLFVFPTRKLKGMLVSATQLQEHLAEEISQYE